MMNITRVTPLYRTYFVLAVTLCLSAINAGVALPQDATTSPSEVQGDAVRGETLFTDTYRCYSCHGSDAQTGERRLKPVKFTQQGFIQFVRNSPLPRMPAYSAVSERDLADILAYIRSIPLDAPEIEQTPLLQEIWTRKLGEFDQ